MTGFRLLVALWAITRSLLVWWYLGPESYAHGDLDHYASALGSLAELGLGTTLVEYPVPALVLLGIPWALAGALGSGVSFPMTMLLMGLAADAAFTIALRRSGPSTEAAQLLWILGVPLLGSVAYGRFDLIPGVLVGAALLALSRAPGRAAAAVAVAAALKLWPAVVLPALATSRASRTRVVGAAALVGGGLAVTSGLTAGWDRLVSPLTWQSDRGLQIESVPATPHMLRWAAGSDGYDLQFSRYVSWEISGSGVHATLTATSLFTGLLVAYLLLLWSRAWRQETSPPIQVVAWLSLAGVTGLIVTSKVLSPQYLMWVLPLAAAATAVTEGDDRRRLVRWSLAALGAAAMSHLVFPTGYSALIERADASLSVTLVLAMRNLTLVLLFLWAAVEASREVRSVAMPDSACRVQVP